MKVLQDNLEFNIVQNVIDYSQNQVIQTDKKFDVFEVGYEIDIIDHDLTKEDTNNVTNSYLISSEFPFPLSGTLYSSAHITESFKESEFRLISFVSDGGIVEEEDSVVTEQNNTIKEENIISSEVIVEEIVENNIVEEIVENNIVEQVIEEPIIEEIIILVESVVEETIEEEFVEKTVDEETITDKETIDTESSSDKSIILVILLFTVIGGVFMYHKKFRNSNNNLKSIVTNDKSTFNKIIHFDDKVTINIKERQ